MKKMEKKFFHDRVSLIIKAKKMKRGFTASSYRKIKLTPPDSRFLYIMFKNLESIK